MRMAEDPPSYDLAYPSRLSQVVGGGWVIDTGSEPGNVSSSARSSLSSRAFLRFSTRADSLPTSAPWEHGMSWGAFQIRGLKFVAVNHLGRVAAAKHNAWRLADVPAANERPLCAIENQTRRGDHQPCEP